ncbi:MAG: hypothetical protein HGA19_06070 [Oscillochloris sp.]|nr:hypothetical protein [Oscillochloris sp.]
MTEFTLRAEDLLAGATLTYQVAIPQHMLQPGSPNGHSAQALVTLRPLTIGTFQLIMKAAKNDASLIPLLMIKESLVQPALTLDQVRGLQLGLVNFLVAHIREVSGLTEKKSPSMS